MSDGLVDFVRGQPGVSVSVKGSEFVLHSHQESMELLEFPESYSLGVILAVQPEIWLVLH